MDFREEAAVLLLSVKSHLRDAEHRERYTLRLVSESDSLITVLLQFRKFRGQVIPGRGRRRTSPGLYDVHFPARPFFPRTTRNE